MSELKHAKRWFLDVRSDLNKIDDAINHYLKVIREGAKHVTAIGHLESLVAETPGLMYFYKCYLTDAQQLRRWLEAQYETEEGAKYVYFQTSAEAKAKYGDLKVTDVKNFVKADEGLMQLMDTIRLVANIEHGFDDIVLGFQNRSIMLSHLVTIRKEGLQEVWIDPTRETVNE